MEERWTFVGLVGQIKLWQSAATDDHVAMTALAGFRIERIVFTTNYDALLESALRDAGIVSAERWVDRLGVEHFVLLWAIATRLLIARWEPEATGSMVTMLDILIGILITRVIPPKAS